MKKITSILLSLIIILFTAHPVAAGPGPSGTPNQNQTIYSDNSTGEMVVRIQIRLRELGYLTYKPTGAYRAMTVEGVKAFQERCGQYGERIDVDGRMGTQSLGRLFEFNAPRSAIPNSVHMPKGPSAEGELKARGELVNWETLKQQLVSGRAYEITDCNTGETFRLIFSGGEKHAEMELASEDELEKFNYICGEEYNFLKRPVVMDINGRLIAASLQCFPHGSDSVADNGMEGHVCIFFEGCLSHVGSLPDVEHNANIFEAAGN